MRSADLLQLSFRAIRAQRLRSFLTLLGIAVGIAAVILLTSIGEGIHRFVLGEFTQFGTNNITVVPGKTRTGGAPSGLPSSARPLSSDDARALEHLPQVVALTPNVRGNAEVQGNGRTRRTLIYGLNSRSTVVFRSQLQSGQFLLPEDDQEGARALVVLGAKLKQELFGAANPLGQRLRIRRSAVPHHRRDGAQGAVPRHRPRRYRLHPDGAGAGVVQPRRARRNQPHRCRRRAGRRRPPARFAKCSANATGARISPSSPRKKCSARCPTSSTS